MHALKPTVAGRTRFPAVAGQPARPRGPDRGALEEDGRAVDGYVRGEASAVALVDSWICAAASPFRRRLAADWPDLLQEARLETLRLLQRSCWRGEARLRTYVWRVVGHTALDAVRRQRRRPVHGTEEELPATPSPEPSALDRLVDEDAERRLLARLESLPQDCRDLWRCLLRGAGYAEIGRELGVAEGALRVRAHRCRKRALAALAG